MTTYNNKISFSNDVLLEKGLRKRDLEPIEISYLVLNVFKEDVSSILHKLSTAINVQLVLPDGSEIPFIPFNEFNNALYEDKVYLYGVSGSGKSRTIYELIKSKFNNLNNIYIINPRNVISETSVEYGRMDIYDLVDRFTTNDAVIWDNFPDDMIKKDTHSGKKAIEIIISKELAKVLIALKPKYLEAYRYITKDIVEVYQHPIVYNREKIKDIVKSYGINTRFKQLYQKYIQNNVDNISHILWKKDPIPLTVLDFYKDLSNKEAQLQYHLKGKEQLDAISIAEALFGAIEYYEHQFRYIRSLDERNIDSEFLYTLRFCYEIGYDRTVHRVEELQKEIFNSVSPKDAAKKLDIWVYLSGPYYCMHDSARHSIKFDDYTQVKIMAYITKNFLKVVPKEKNQIHAFGIYLGKNFQFILRSDSNQFLPDHIYDYMKSNRYFEKSFSQGIGEIFFLLDEESQKVVLDRLDIDIEFAEGFGFSLGMNFNSLDDICRQKVFERIYSGMPFASYFGESLGQVFQHLSKNIQKEIFDQIKKNVLFANGVGRGFGYSYSLMDVDLQHEIFEKANTNSELTLGLGLGIGKNFSSLNKESQINILQKTEKNHIFDQGLGHGLGYNFEQFSVMFREKILLRAQKSVQLMFGIGFGVGITFTFLSEAFQKEMIERADSDGEFGYGLGMGLGYAFGYLPAEYQTKLIVKMEGNRKFGYGLGCGFGLVYKYLPDRIKNDILLRADKNSEFDQGLGFGIGLTFTYLPFELQEQMFKRTSKYADFGYGLTYALGYTFTYLQQDLQMRIIYESENNLYLKRGLGSGYAYALQYRSNINQKVFEKIDYEPELAVGFGMGIGRLFKYFSIKIRKKIFDRLAEYNPFFAYGLGHGFGYVYTYQTENIQKEIFEKAEYNPFFAYGLGHGLGNSFTYINEDSQQQLFEKAEYNPEFAYGLGHGLGQSLKYLSNSVENKITVRSANNIQLDTGFGSGIGTILYKCLTLEEKEKIKKKIWLYKNTGFSRGIGLGLGRVFSYLDTQQQEELFNLAKDNTQFAIGLGEGISIIYFNSQKKLSEHIFKEIYQSPVLARGYGEGLGCIFKYVLQRGQKDILMGLVNDQKFSRGIGLGLGRVFSYLDTQQQEELFNLAKDNTQFAIGLGLGLGRVFSYLDTQQQEELFNLAKDNTQFGKSLIFSISNIFKYISKLQQTEILEKILNQKEQSALVKSLGEGLGYNFISLTSKQQENVFTIVYSNNDFAEGLSNGIGQIYKHLDEILQIRILELTLHNDIFSVYFGKMVGNNFPSLSSKIQKIILQFLEMDNGERFAKSFTSGIENSLKYLDKDLQKKLLSKLSKV